VGGVRLRAAARRPRQAHPGERRLAVWAQRRGEGARRPAADRGRQAAARVRADGPLGGGAGQHLPAAEGGAELVADVPRAGGRVRRGGAGAAAGSGAGKGQGADVGIREGQGRCPWIPL